MPEQEELPALLLYRRNERQRAGVEALFRLAVTAGPGVGLLESLPRREPGLPAPGIKTPTSATAPGRYGFLRSRWLLPVILVAQVALSVRLVWSNSAFQDEALYIWAGRLELAHWAHGSYMPPVDTYFSGAPVLYPPLAALANSADGLAGARLLSLAFMLAATVLLYASAKRLFERGTAVAAVALFATFGMADQLGAFATYDAMALALLALAAWLAVRATGRLSEPLLILAACSLALADATKYASTLWNPVVLALAAMSASEEAWLRKIWRGTRVAVYTGLIVAPALYAGGRGYVRGIMFTTIQRQIVTGTAPLKIIDIAWGWLALLLLLGLLGVLLIWLDNGRMIALPIAMFAAALLAPIEQAHISDITSLHKHVVFGAWFLCLVAGYAVNRISRLDGQLSHGIVIGLVLIAVVAATGFSQAAAVTRDWPPVSRVMPALAKAIADARCPCLIFQASPARYYLPASDLASQVTGPYTFTYRDSQTWTALGGHRAMAAAIRNGYFGVVEIDATRGAVAYRLLVSTLRRSRLYRLTASQPWSLHPHTPTQVWERIAGSAR